MTKNLKNKKGDGALAVATVKRAKRHVIGQMIADSEGP